MLAAWVAKAYGSSVHASGMWLDRAPAHHADSELHPASLRASTRSAAILFPPAERQPELHPVN